MRNLWRSAHAWVWGWATRRGRAHGRYLVILTDAITEADARYPDRSPDDPFGEAYVCYHLWASHLIGARGMWRDYLLAEWSTAELKAARR